MPAAWRVPIAGTLFSNYRRTISIRYPSPRPWTYTIANEQQTTRLLLTFKKFNSSSAVCCVYLFLDKYKLNPVKMIGCQRLTLFLGVVEFMCPSVYPRGAATVFFWIYSLRFSFVVSQIEKIRWLAIFFRFGAGFRFQRNVVVSPMNSIWGLLTWQCRTENSHGSENLFLCLVLGRLCPTSIATWRVFPNHSYSLWSVMSIS